MITTALVATLFIWALATATVSAATGWTYRLLRRQFLKLDPHQHANFMLLLAVLPAAISVCWIGLVFAPAVADWTVDKHCHALGHCSPHAPVLGAVPLGAASAAFASLAVLCAFAVAGLRWRAAIQQSRTLQTLAREDGCGHAVIETFRPIALCVGWLRPRVIISSGLYAVASTEELAIIMAHEDGHARRRDNLRYLVAASLTMLMPRTSRQLLLGDLRASTEQACDANAVAEVGSRLQVAEAVLKFTRLASEGNPLHASGFGDSNVVERVRTLVHPPRRRIRPAWWLATEIPLLAALLLIGPAAIHHLIETVLKYL